MSLISLIFNIFSWNKVYCINNIILKSYIFFIRYFQPHTMYSEYHFGLCVFAISKRCVGVCSKQCCKKSIIRPWINFMWITHITSCLIIQRHSPFVNYPLMFLSPLPSHKFWLSTMGYNGPFFFGHKRIP